MAILKEIIAGLKFLFLGSAEKPRTKSKKTKRTKPLRRNPPKNFSKKKSAKAPKTSKPSLVQSGNTIKKRQSKSKATTKAPGENKENFVGEITHFFPKIQVCVLKVASTSVKIGDTIQIRGAHQFIQKVKSLQIESVDVKEAKKNQLVGLALVKPAKVGDRVFRC